MKSFVLLLCILLSSATCGRVEFPIGGNLAPGGNSGNPVFVDAMLECAGIDGLPYSATVFPHAWHDTTDFGIGIVDYNIVQPETNGTWSIVVENADDDTLVQCSQCTFVDSTYDNVTHRYVAHVDVTTSLHLVVRNYRCPAATRSIKAIRPGYPIDGYPRFTKTFLGLIENLNTLRMMDWLLTNNYDAVANWSDRYTLAAPTYCRVPHEILIELANLAQKNLWVNVPVSATDDYVEQMAQLYHSSLQSHLILYVEFGNELWNFMFIQWPIHYSLANAEPYRSILNFDNETSPNPYEIGAKWNGYRLGEIAHIFMQYYGAAAINKQLRMILGTQWGAIEQLTPPTIAIQKLFPGIPGDLIFACAAAPYLGLSGGPYGTVEEYLDDINKTIQTYWTSQTSQLNICRGLGMQFVSYEGGSGILQSGSVEIMQELYLDPRATDLMVEYYDSFFRAGYGLFNNYAIGTWGYMWPWASYWDPAVPTMVGKSIDIVSKQSIIEPDGKTTYILLPGRWDYPQSWFNWNNGVSFPSNIMQIFNPHSTDAVYNMTVAFFLRLDWINHLNIQICIDGRNCTEMRTLQGTDWFYENFTITVPRGQHWVSFISDDLKIDWNIKWWTMNETSVLATDSYQHIKWNYEPEAQPSSTSANEPSATDGSNASTGTSEGDAPGSPTSSEITSSAPQLAMAWAALIACLIVC